MAAGAFTAFNSAFILKLPPSYSSFALDDALNGVPTFVLHN